jgi:hypothetical protein
MFASCHTFAFICCVCDFMVELKSGEQGVSFNCFSILNQRIPARSAVEFVRKECVTAGFK